MNNQNKVLGAIFILVGLVNLVHPEWLNFGIFTAVGIGLLIDQKKSATHRIIQIGLAFFAFSLIILRLTTDFQNNYR